MLGSLAVAAVLIGAVPAAAATSGQRLATVVAPKHRVIVTGSGLTVRVRVGAGTRLRADVDGRPVTGRFGAARNGIRTARLRRGQELRQGLNHVYVHTSAGSRKDLDVVDAITARRDRGFLTIKGAPRRATRRAPVVQATWRDAPDHLRARLNGRDVRREFLTRAGTTKPAHLGADDGLRFGRNRLVVSAYNDEGRYDREVRRFSVARKAPLVGTGPDRWVAQGTPLRLDGRKSRPARPGGRLSFRWSIVRRPHGSKARLRDARGARPTLVPDVRGRYRLRLRVTERPRRKSTGRAAQAVPLQPPGEAPLQPPGGLQTLTASSTMEVLSPTLPGPMGYPVSTIPGGTGGIQVAGTTYRTSANWVQVLLLDRATLEPKDAPSANLPQANHPGTGQYAFDTGDNPQLLRNLVTGSSSKIDASYLVLMTGGGRSIAIDKPQWQALTSAFGQLGGTMDPFVNNGKGNSDPGFGNGAWSLIGIPGLTKGTAAQNAHLVPGPSQAAGNLLGRLALDSKGNYTFNPGDYRTFDTNGTGQNAASGGANVMNVNGTSYASNTLPAGESGFHVLILDAGGLGVVANHTFVTNSSSGQVVDGVQAMAAAIKAGKVDDLLILIQSIGAPNPLNQAWTGPSSSKGPASLSEAIDAIGGTRDLFNSLAAGGSKWGYALVGGSELSQTEAAEQALNPESVGLVPPPARLRGLLKRGDEYHFQPTTTSSFDSPAAEGFDLSALTLAFQPSEDTWPTHDTPAHRAAEDYVARQVFYPDYTPTEQGYDLHTYYWYFDWLDDAGTPASALADVCPQSGSVTAPPNVPFDSADLQLVCAQVHREFTWVQAVWGMTRSLNASFLQQEIKGPANATAIAKTITDALQKERGSDPTSGIVADLLLVEGTLLEAASEVMFAVGGEDGLGGAAAIGTMSGIFDMMSDFANSSTGSPDLATFDTEAKSIGTDIQSQYGEAITATGKLSQLLVSDYAKLSTAGPKAQDPNTWAFGQNRLTQLQNSLQLSTTRYIWSKLMPGGFKVYNLGAGGRGWNQEGQGTWTPKTYTCYNNDNGLDGGELIRPWRKAHSSAWQNQTVGIKKGKPYRQPNLLGGKRVQFSGYGGNNAIEGYPAGPAPSSLTDPMFKPVIPGQYTSATSLTQLGLNKPEFLSESQRIFTRVNVRC